MLQIVGEATLLSGKPLCSPPPATPSPLHLPLAPTLTPSTSPPPLQPTLPPTQPTTTTTTTPQNTTTTTNTNASPCDLISGCCANTHSSVQMDIAHYTTPAKTCIIATPPPPNPAPPYIALGYNKRATKRQLFSNYRHERSVYIVSLRLPMLTIQIIYLIKGQKCSWNRTQVSYN